MAKTARVLRVIGWLALFAGALFVTVAIYFTGVYGGTSAVGDLFSLAQLPGLLALLSALLPGVLMLAVAKLAAAADAGRGPGDGPGDGPTARRD